METVVTIRRCEQHFLITSTPTALTWQRSPVAYVAPDVEKRKQQQILSQQGQFHCRTHSMCIHLFALPAAQRRVTSLLPKPGEHDNWF